MPISDKNTEIQILAKRENFILYRSRDSKNRKILIRASTEENPSETEIGQYRNDFQIGQKLSEQSHRILRPRKLEIDDNRLQLQLEDPGVILVSQMPAIPMPLKQFLQFAAETVRALQDIHDNGIIHNFINPESIFPNPDSGEVLIGNFILASPDHGVDHSIFLFPRRDQSRYAYISPEQTGRMNLIVDYRTDFYSLGVVFYQLLTGTLPLFAEDTLSWFHAHMTTAPLPLTQHLPEIPEVVNQIVSKLLKKMPASRYQNTRGLLYDLKKCILSLSTEGKIPPFPIASEDRIPIFKPPLNLYGREAEVAYLSKNFDEAASSGKLVFTLISGFSGVGKTSLVREIGSLIHANHGILATGKFEQGSENVPYYTITSALREIILDILASGEKEIQFWRSQLLEEIGTITQVITGLIPELAVLLGNSGAIPLEELPPAEAEHRVFRSIQTFISLIAKKEHSLVLFLDDLQWSDIGTLKLLEYIVVSNELTYFFLIGAYRDNEVGPDHPLIATIDKIKLASPFTHEIRLQTLTQSSVRRLVAEGLNDSSSQIVSLADLVFEKTGGNPFFILQFLKLIIAEGLLRFKGKSGRWDWQSEQIALTDYTENAVHLMILVLNRLPSETKNALMLAAHVGNKFTASTLAEVAEVEMDEMKNRLQSADQERLISKAKNTYIFQHDRIRQAAFLLADSEQHAGIHLKIARVLHRQTPQNMLKENIFEIVNQFNSALPAVSDAKEKNMLSELNLQAGKKAKEAAAYNSAMEFLTTGISLVGTSPWASDYRITYEILLQLSECTYLSGRFNEAEQILKEIVENAKSPVEKSKAYRVWMNLHTTKGEMIEAVSSGLEALEILDWKIPANPSEEEVMAAYDSVWKLLTYREIESLIDLPLMTNERMLASLNIMASIPLPAHFLGLRLNMFLTAQIVNISIQHGITADSVHAFSWFATTLIDREIAHYSDGYRFGKLSYDLMKKHNYLSCRSKVCLFFGDIVNFYTKHLKSDRAFIHEGFAAGIASGDLISACYHCNHLITNMLAAANPLDQTLAESRRCLEFVRKVKDRNIENILISQQRFILSLKRKPSGNEIFSDGVFSQSKFEGQIQNSEMTLMKFWYYILKMSAYFFYGDFSYAADASFAAQKYSFSDRINMESTQYPFFSALALAGHYDEVSDEKRAEYMQIILWHTQQLRILAENCPANFENRFLLVSAEVARLKNDPANAMRLYEMAARSAEKNGFWQNAAIAYELAFKLHCALGLSTSAMAYLRKALSSYQRWGATGKVEELKKNSFAHQNYPCIEPADEASSHPGPSFSGLVDLDAVTKAQRAISSNLAPEGLHETFLQITLENSGAQRGAFVLFRNGILTVEAELDGNQVKVNSIPLEIAESVPGSIIQYVAKLKTKVLLNDARLPNPFSADKYLTRIQPKSILCMPIIRQDELMAIIYLENNLTTHSFAANHLAVLEMLASQAAISIENSYLYDDLRRSIRARDEFIGIASHELKSPLNSVNLYIQTLRNIVQKGRIAEYPEAKLLSILDASIESVRSLATLVDQLLDVSRFTLSTLTIKREPVDLNAVINEVVIRFQKDLRAAGCEVELDLAPQINGDWDRLRIEQVLNNLLSNSIKYAAGKPISIKSSLQDGKAILTIADQGIGISQKDRKRLFRPFERAVSYLSISGFGLGLYIIKKIVEAHEGVIELESELGKGTIFRIELPLHVNTSDGELHVA